MLALLVVAFASGCGGLSGRELTLGYLGWDENVANSNLIKVILEEEFDYDAVKLKLAEDDPVAYAFLNTLRLSEEELISLETEIGNAGDDAIKGTNAWLEDNHDVVQPAIDAAKKAQGS